MDDAGADPVDYRFLLANERTYLACTRTALALQVAGLGILQFLTHAQSSCAYLLGVALVAAGSYLGVAGYRRFRSNERAMRAGSRPRAEPVRRGDRGRGGRRAAARRAAIALIALFDRSSAARTGPEVAPDTIGCPNGHGMPRARAPLVRWLSGRPAENADKTGTKSRDIGQRPGRQVCPLGLGTDRSLMQTDDVALVTPAPAGAPRGTGAVPEEVAR